MVTKTTVEMVTPMVTDLMDGGLVVPNKAEQPELSENLPAHCMAELAAEVEEPIPEDGMDMAELAAEETVPDMDSLELRIQVAEVAAPHPLAVRILPSAALLEVLAWLLYAGAINLKERRGN